MLLVLLWKKERAFEKMLAEWQQENMKSCRWKWTLPRSNMHDWMRHLQESVPRMSLELPEPPLLAIQGDKLPWLFFFNKWKYSVNCENWSPPGGWKMTLSIFRRCRFRICCLCSQEKMVMESLAEIQRFLGCLSQPITLAYITWQSASFCCIETTWNPICILYEQPSENGRGED